MIVSGASIPAYVSTSSKSFSKIGNLLSFFIQQNNPSFSITFDTVKWSITNDKDLLKVNNL